MHILVGFNFGPSVQKNSLDKVDLDFGKPNFHKKIRLNNVIGKL